MTQRILNEIRLCKKGDDDDDDDEDEGVELGENEEEQDLQIVGCSRPVLLMGKFK